MTDTKEADRKDREERLKLFLTNKTYTFLKIINSSNRLTFFNGFIKSINDKEIIFTEDELGEIPIRKIEIVDVDYSRKRKND